MSWRRNFLRLVVVVMENECTAKDYDYGSFKQGYALKNWVERLSDEVFYPWESPKKIRLKSVNAVNPTFVTKQKKVSIQFESFSKS